MATPQRQQHSKRDSMTQPAPAVPCPRLLDYYCVFGAEASSSDQPLMPMRKLSRTNSQFIQPINEMKLVMTGDRHSESSRHMSGCRADSLSHGWHYVCAADQPHRPVNINSGLMRQPIYLAYSRALRSDSQYSVTGVQVIFLDQNEQPSPGYSILQPLLPRTITGRQIAICIQRDIDKPPITDIQIMNLRSSIEAMHHSEWVTVRHSLPGKLYIQLKCQRDQQRTMHTYTPTVIDRVPLTDYSDYSPDWNGIAMMVFPAGIQLSASTAVTDNENAVWRTFVCTTVDGSYVYGTALIYWIKQPQQQQNGRVARSMSRYGSHSLSPDRRMPVLAQPLALCLLSHYPHYHTHQTLLHHLYCNIRSQTLSLPVEAYLSTILSIPIPNPHQPIVRFRMPEDESPPSCTIAQTHTTQQWTHPSPFALPALACNLRPFLQRLSTTSILTIVEHLLLEGKLCLYSSQLSCLTPICETIRALIWPLTWQCVYIPLLPSNLTYVLRAPVPFIIGLHRSIVDELQIPTDVMLVDVDKNLIRMPYVEDDDELPTLPPVITQQLQALLQPLHPLFDSSDKSMLNEATIHNLPPMHSAEHEQTLRLAMLQLTTHLLADVRSYITLSDEQVTGSQIDLDRLFQRHLYAQHFNASLQPFAQQLIETQMFSDFILQRVTYSDKWLNNVLLFDWMIALTRGGDDDELSLQRLHRNSSSGFNAMLSILSPRKLLAGSTSKRQIGDKLNVGQLTWDVLQHIASHHQHHHVQQPTTITVQTPTPQATSNRMYLYDTVLPPIQQQLVQQFTPSSSTTPSDSTKLHPPTSNPHHALSQRYTLAQQKILRSLYTQLTTLVAKHPSLGGDHRLVVGQVTAIYELWFLLFTDYCRQQRAVRLMQHSLAFHDQTSPVPTSSPPSSVAHTDSEHTECQAELLTMLVELHAMCQINQCLPTQSVLEVMLSFCLESNLHAEAQLVYRLFSVAVPQPTVHLYDYLMAGSGSSPPPQTTPDNSNSPRTIPFPDLIETSAECAKCLYQLSGEEIVSGWLLTEKLQFTACPLCHNHISPQLLLTFGNNISIQSALPDREIEYLRPRIILNTLQSLYTLQYATPQSAAPPSYLTLLRDNTDLLYNIFFLFATRGARPGGFGQLPYLFMFDVDETHLTTIPHIYVPDLQPFQPWRLQMQSLEMEVSPRSPASVQQQSVFELSRSHDLSPHDTQITVITEVDESESIHSPNMAASPSGEESTPVQQQRSMEINPALLQTPQAATNRPRPSLIQTDMSPLIRHSQMSPLASSPSAFYAPSLSPASPRRKRSNDISMTIQHVLQTVQEPIQAAVVEILKARKQLKASEDNGEIMDVADTCWWSASMFKQIASLIQQHDPATDLLALRQSYAQAIDWINTSIVTHQKALALNQQRIHDLQNGLTNLLSPLTNSFDRLHVTNAPEIHADEIGQLQLKRHALQVALCDLESLAAELLPCDAVPSPVHLQLIPTLRSVYATATLQQQQNFTTNNHHTNTSASEPAYYATLLDQLVSEEVPPIDAILVQSSHSTRYTLSSFQQYCATRRAQLLEHKPHVTVAESLVDFWLAVRRFRVRYERAIKNNSLSFTNKGQTPKNQVDALQNAKNVFLHYLLPVHNDGHTHITASDIDTLPLLDLVAGDVATRCGVKLSPALYNSILKQLQQPSSAAALSSDGVGSLRTRSRSQSNASTSPTTLQIPVGGPLATTPTNSRNKPVSKTVFDTAAEIALTWLREQVYPDYIESLMQGGNNTAPTNHATKHQLAYNEQKEDSTANQSGRKPSLVVATQRTDSVIDKPKSDLPGLSLLVKLKSLAAEHKSLLSPRRQALNDVSKFSQRFANGSIFQSNNGNNK